MGFERVKSLKWTAADIGWRNIPTVAVKPRANGLPAHERTIPIPDGLLELGLSRKCSDTCY